MKRKIIAVLLCLTILLAMIPDASIPVLAEGESVAENEGTYVGKIGQFNDTSVTLYKGVDNVDVYMTVETNNLPETFSVEYQYTGMDGSAWYLLSSEQWPSDYADYRYVPEKVITILEEQEYEDKEGSVEGVEELTVKVAGNIPKDVVLSLTPADNTDINLDNLDHPNLSSKNNIVAAIDIQLINDDGSEWQPNEGEKVSVSLNAAFFGFSDDDEVYVIHKHDNGDIEVIESAPLRVENGNVTFETDGFSVFYIVSGTNNISSGASTDATDLSTGEHTYYIEAGTAMTFCTSGGENNNADITWTAVETSEYITTDKNTISVNSAATPGTTAKYTATWNSWGVKTADLTFIVATREQIIDGAIDGVITGVSGSESQNYPVILAFLTNSEDYPNEPAVTVNKSYVEIVNENGTYSTSWWGGDFASTGNGIIDPEIAEALIPDVNDTSTVGIYDATGTNCKRYLNNIDWEQVTNVVLNYATTNNNRIYASDGERITSDNKDQYEVIPYVVKLMSNRDVGWHIDCAIVPKDTEEVKSVTLQYNLNLDNYRAPGLGLPPSVTEMNKIETGVERINGLDADDQVTATNGENEYILTFLHWNTSPDGTGVSYNPDDQITVTQDTILYAIWQGELAPGSLKIVKTIVNENIYYPAPAGDEFIFIVTFSGEDEQDYTDLNYKIYNVTNETTAISSAKISSGETIILKGGQYALIENVPVGAYSVTEDLKEGYTITSTNASGSILTLKESVATFVNTYTYVPQNTSLTITKTGANTIDENQSFIFNVKGTDDTTEGIELTVVVNIAGGNTSGSVTINDLPIGTYTVTENNDWSWRYSVHSISGTIVTDSSGNAGNVRLEADAGTNVITFSNKRDEIYWLSGDAYADNNFANTTTTQ